jgi:cytochrome P450
MYRCSATSHTDSMPLGRNEDPLPKSCSYHGTDPIVLNRAFETDPHTLYDVLRVERPVARAVTAQGLPVWLVTRHADVRAALADDRLAKDGAALSAVRARLTGSDPAGPAADIEAHLLNTDPPDHTRLRKLVARGFTRQAVAALEPWVESIAADLADALPTVAEEAEDGVVDLLDGFAFPFAVSAICAVLGIQPGSRDTFARWVRIWNSSTVAPAERAQTGRAMRDYMSQVIEQKRAHPGDDIMSVIVHAHEDGDRLSPQEAVAMAFLLFAAGFETTVNLIGNGMYALLRDPGQLAVLRAEPSLVPRAIEEFSALTARSTWPPCASPRSR